MFQTLRRPFALPSILVGCDIPQYIGWYTPRTNHQPLPVPPARGPGPWVPWVPWVCWVPWVAARQQSHPPPRYLEPGPSLVEWIVSPLEYMYFYHMYIVSTFLFNYKHICCMYVCTYAYVSTTAYVNEHDNIYIF